VMKGKETQIGTLPTMSETRKILPSGSCRV
jgi:hypothetical protein